MQVHAAAKETTKTVAHVRQRAVRDEEAGMVVLLVQWDRIVVCH
jgi:hypothetical protein